MVFSAIAAGGQGWMVYRELTLAGLQGLPVPAGQRKSRSSGSLPGCTRSLQLSLVAIRLPLLQLAAELFVTSYFTGRPVQPQPKRWDARISGGPPAQPRAYAEAGSHRRRASSATSAYAVGRPDQLRVSQLSRGSTRWRARNQQPRTSRVVGSSDGLDSPGRSAQPRDTRWALQGTATRRAARREPIQVRSRRPA